MCSVRFLLLVSFAISIGSSASHVIKREAGESFSFSDHVAQFKKVKDLTSEFAGHMRENLQEFKGGVDKLISTDLASDNVEKKATAEKLQSGFKMIEENSLTSLDTIEKYYNDNYEKLLACQEVSQKIGK